MKTRLLKKLRIASRRKWAICLTGEGYYFALYGYGKYTPYSDKIEDLSWAKEMCDRLRREFIIKRLNQIRASRGKIKIIH